MINAPLLGRTLGHIKTYPELHDQSNYFSLNEFGVAACFAGRALLISGYMPYLLGSPQEGSVSNMSVSPEGLPDFAYNQAKTLLGLNGIQASGLFKPTNTYAMLEERVDRLLLGVHGLTGLERSDQLIPVNA